MKKLLIYILPVMLLVSCAKDLDEYNVDQKNPTMVDANSLFGNAVKELSDNQASSSINVNIFRLWVQHWTTTTYQDEPRYNFITRNIPLAYWTPFYREVLQDLKESRRLTDENTTLSEAEKNNRIALIEVVSVYTWSILVNTWGDVPYTEAISTVNQPKYDKAADIYADLFKRLDAAIALMTPGSNFGSADLLYNDDTSGWIKFAHSLKMKLAITIADVDENLARTAIQSSAPNAFTSNADNASFAYRNAPPNNNPISNSLNPIYTTRQDFIAGITLVNKMNATEDPRRPFYFTTVNGNYVGGQIGVNNNYANFSHISEKIINPEFEALLLDYAEVEFILAEAAARWGILGTPAEHYNNAITASITYWGGTAAQVATYLAMPTVAYASAAGDYKQKIGEQKYIALYNRGNDAWTEWRRLDYPRLTPAANALSVIPLRLTYPTSERTLNSANVESAAASIGGDEVSTKIFWDKF
ncbi:SusD/RagB family nutrient-binding outer membrane lipoprotein [Pedobacter sp.]|uniref:SusD/RagB family nutrient-binding outer membrane lipoprotein n=1 Tax=Pedobacter sp. TaxID=1411316 RepID=UPI003D7FEEDE